MVTGSVQSSILYREACLVGPCMSPRTGRVPGIQKGLHTWVFCFRTHLGVSDRKTPHTDLRNDFLAYVIKIPKQVYSLSLFQSLSLSLYCLHPTPSPAISQLHFPFGCYRHVVSPAIPSEGHFFLFLNNSMKSPRFTFIGPAWSMALPEQIMVAERI